MKIAFINSSTGWGGLEMNTLKLAKLLKEKGYNITLISQENSTIYKNAKDEFASTFLLKKIRRYFDFLAAKKIADILKRENINTLLAFDNKDLDVVAWTKKLFYNKLQIVYQQHMQIGINKKDFIHTLRFKSIDNWISPLQYLKKEVVEKTKFPEERIRIIPLGVDTSKYIHKKYTQQEARQKLNIAPKAPLIGIIGRISRKKGQGFLVESLIKLKQAGINIELLIFGSATVNDPECQQYFTEIKQIVHQNKLDDIVHFVDFHNDVSLFYNAIDIFVLASHSETYGMVTIEAMLSQLPILATQSGGTSEILAFGKLGLLYEYENFQDFSQKLIWLLNNKDAREAMAIAAQKVAAEKYAQEVEINELDLLVKSLMKKPPNP